jgi:hypothetical protein
MVSSGASYRVPDETERLFQAIEEVRTSPAGRRIMGGLLDRDYADEDHWMVRAVMGFGLPSPMTFEMLESYLTTQGHEVESVEQLRELLREQLHSLTLKERR